MPIASNMPSGSVVSGTPGSGVAAPASRLAGRTIYVVDDEKSMTIALSAMLGREGARCRSFNSAREALDALRGLPDGPERPELAVVDMSFIGEALAVQGASGIEGASVVRAAAAAGIPVLVVTADASPEVATSARDAGARLIVIKPVTRESLVKAALRVLVEARRGLVLDQLPAGAQE